jgi:NADH-quinone oxidoreductase subunit N
MIMIIAGIGFKLAVVPFHIWTPDVYEGAPAPVTAFIASVSKGGVFAFLLRFFTEIQAYNYKPLMITFTVISVASMFTGNFLALLQNNIKRVLAYSSITHLGYLLIALIVSQYSGVRAGSFYLVAYFITIIGAFGIVSAISPVDKDTDNIEDYKGLFWRRPWIAAIFSSMLFSLAGIPLTIGFFGKFYLISAGIENYQWLLIIALVVNSAISIYYYLRIVVAMFSKPTEEEISNYNLRINPSIAIGSSFALACLFIALIWLGVYPTGVMNLIDMMVKF